MLTPDSPYQERFAALNQKLRWEVADELRTARVPYVFASASNPSELPADHRWAPFFSKPYPITSLINAVEESRLSGVPIPG